MTLKLLHVYIFLWLFVYDFSGSFVRRKDCPCVAGDCLVEKSLQLTLENPGILSKILSGHPVKGDFQTVKGDFQTVYIY